MIFNHLIESTSESSTGESPQMSRQIETYLILVKTFTATNLMSDDVVSIYLFFLILKTRELLFRNVKFNHRISL